MIDVFAELGLVVLERGWLSSNNIVFRSAHGTPATVVDTGYGAHSAQTCTLLAAQLGSEPLGRMLNTHLHSDHCGGNAALQSAWGCEVWVPEASFDAVRSWDASTLTFEQTDQRCERFSAQKALHTGSSVQLGEFAWQVIAAPGHDPDAVMLFQRDSGVLITADALWEERLAIIFPELAGESGFSEARGALDVIEQLAPKVVIPGHGRPFTDVSAALANSRRRITQFEAEPARHLRYAERALTMFHMLEYRSLARDALVAWLAQTPIFHGVVERQTGVEDGDRKTHAAAVLTGLLQAGQLCMDDAGTVHIA